MSRRILLAIPSLVALAAYSGVLRAANTLSLSATAVTLTCAKSGSCTTVPVTLTDSVPEYYTVNAGTVPSWLSVSPMSGSSTSATLTFTAGPVWATLAVGSYSAVVQIQPTTGTAQLLPVTLEIGDAAPGLTVLPTDPDNVTWTMGSTYPTISLTVYSTTTTLVPFSVTVASTPTAGGVSNWLTTNLPPGNSIAYVFGTTIPLTVSATAYQQMQAGDTVAGTVTINYGGTLSKLVHINITAAPPQPHIVALSPAAVPVVTTSTAGNVTIAISGTNFAQSTKVFTALGSATPAICNNCQTVLNSANMTVRIPYLADGSPFKAAGTLTIGLSNAANPTVPQTTMALPIVTYPIINSIVSASSLAQPGASGPTLAPYDLITIFGANFCPPAVAQCSNPMVGALDPTFRYPAFLTPDGGPHKLAVMFSKLAGAGPTWTNVPSYLLFANNNQINALVPAAISNQVGPGTVKVVVSFDASATTPAAANSSVAYPVNVALTDPGAFTLDSNGDGAILDASSYALITQMTPATAGSTTIAIYMTGLGIPNSNASDTAPMVTGPPQACLNPLGAAGTPTTPPTGYMGAVNTGVTSPGYTPPSGYSAPITPWQTIDGAIVRTALFAAPTVLPPCFLTASNPTVMIGTVAVPAAGVTYAGFVGDSVAGLYQVNVPVPAALTAGGGPPAAYPLVVTMGGIAAPPVLVWIQ